jgi:hypothetical protein
MGVCFVEGCTDQAKIKTICKKHYEIYLKYGDVNYIPSKKAGQGTVCLIEGCREEIRSNGLCNNHISSYRYHKKAGKVLDVNEFIDTKKVGE